MRCYVKINGQTVEITQNEGKSGVLFFYNNNLYLWNKPGRYPALMEKFAGKGKIGYSLKETGRNN